ncbi:potassium-transporting ATPase subunit KdpA [Streptococcus pseudoporcinus]|uniref:Potassium-transporting ATPase potassium-binding subunit n=2 Tax=Streptococcus pseudoporcinus TaxID=361101 RepID=G5KAR3_9STRE|nr:potassium-transporting ATPase subunit KdpA [Streptococcus pseudoporcinus]EFR44575.1 K+-transporting ATPase, A subunit [Streptococcus pseudoporcinus SPIN 20026]EHI65752.1 potassium-transporting ATPase A subunit [Streptococcus pseudoporcinus LQ 940-04]VEF93142.1 potassium-transporting ATPase subunit A [Streptococcus pseudoporcinus]VTS16131.1 potassium-transporting ATPase subunit A [Streptococcus pseudoporcinus]VUC67834.1 potassium-transporting ATPase subunit A [Streptococcus pseudoporcinus]
MLQIIFVLTIACLLILPTGKYLYHIASQQKTFADPIMDPIDRGIYRLLDVDKKGMTWKQYAVALVLTNAVMALVAYVILRTQAFLFLNPNRVGPLESSLSFNTVISFITNSNLQDYVGERDLSFLSQMVVITFMMFTSAASGYAAAMAFIRGVSGKYQDMGNFYVDFVRVITRVLLPFSIVGALVLISQGVPQTLAKELDVTTLEGKLQGIAMGPVASLEIIKHLGTNGGGFFAANSAAPFENPNVITNIIEMLSMMLLPGAMLVAFGYMVAAQRKGSHPLPPLQKASSNPMPMQLGRQARPLLLVMTFLFLAGLALIVWSESKGNPFLHQLGLNQSMGNMEGKEVRFGIPMSGLFTEITTAFTTGSVNNMHDTLTPLSGGVAMVNMMLNVIFGGKGVGLMNMMLYVLLTVFICGLMIGRTPVYLGKKIEGKEMTLIALGIVVHPVIILGFSALAVLLPAGLSSVSNPGFHGLSQVIYQFTSASANNGSGFEGLKDNTPFWNVSTGLAMFLGRYVTLILQLAVAGSLMTKSPVNASLGSLKTETGTFTLSLGMVVLIISALTFLPTLVLGPLAEFLTQ